MGWESEPIRLGGEYEDMEQDISQVIGRDLGYVTFSEFFDVRFPYEG